LRFSGLTSTNYANYNGDFGEITFNLIPTGDTSEDGRKANAVFLEHGSRVTRSNDMTSIEKGAYAMRKILFDTTMNKVIDVYEDDLKDDLRDIISELQPGNDEIEDNSPDDGDDDPMEDGPDDGGTGLAPSTDTDSTEEDEDSSQGVTSSGNKTRKRKSGKVRGMWGVCMFFRS
jgi:hypothetical protein